MSSTDRPDGPSHDGRALIDLTGDGVAAPDLGQLRPAPIELTNSASMLSRACEWMRYFAFSDAVVSVGPEPFINSSRGLAMVETSSRVVGRRMIEEFDLVRSRAGKYGIYFALVGFNAKAVKAATSAGIALFRLDNNGQVAGVGDFGRRLLAGSDRRHVARATGHRADV
jgi:hypothetical protein